jgi:uncharacterized repeat protein (TIGR01451 family)
LPVANFSLTNLVDADIGVTKAVDTDQATAGSNLTYTITVQNTGSTTVNGVTLSDTLPGNLEFVSLTKPATWSCMTPQVGQGGTISCTNQSLAANATDVFTLVAKIPVATQQGTFYENIATVGSETPDPNEENNSSSASTTVITITADLGDQDG